MAEVTFIARVLAKFLQIICVRPATPKFPQCDICKCPVLHLFQKGEYHVCRECAEDICKVRKRNGREELENLSDESEYEKAVIEWLKSRQ